MNMQLGLLWKVKTMKKKLIRTSILVKAILEECPETRDDDNLLYLKACQFYNPSNGMFPFATVLTNSASYFIPSYKSVERARRKIQAEHPELAAKRKVKEKRIKAEQDYKSFARGELDGNG